MSLQVSENFCCYFSIQYYAHCSLTIIISVDVTGVQGKTTGTKRAREDGHAGEHCMETELNMIDPIPITSPSDIGEDFDDDFEAVLELLRMPDPLEAVVKSAISNPDCSIDLEYLQHALNAGYSFSFILHRVSVALDTNLYRLPPKKLIQRRRGFETAYSI